MTPLPQRRFGPIDTARVLAGTAFLMLPVALFAPKAMAPLFGLAAVLVLVLNFQAGRILEMLKRPTALILIAFLALAAISFIWAAEPMAALKAVSVLALTFFGGLYLIDTVARLDTAQRWVLCQGIIAGGLLALCLIVFESFSEAWLTRKILEAKGVEFSAHADYLSSLNAGMSVFALYLWPLALIIKNRFGTAITALALVAGVVVIFLSSADTPILALLAGLGVAALSLVSRKAVLGSFAALALIGTALAPLLPGALPDPHTEARVFSMLSNSAIHRLAIWRTVVEHISENPVAGIGLNGTRYLYGDSDKFTRWYATDDKKKKWGNFAEPIPLHAHNGVLQIWLELGAMGALIFAGGLLAVLWRIRRSFPDAATTAARLGMLTSGLVIFCLSFGPWQGWWQAAMWLSLALMTAAGKPEEAKH